MKISRKLGLYLLLSFGISWTLALIYFLIRGYFASTNIPFMVLGICFMFAPMISVILIEKKIFRQKIVRIYPLQFKWNRWWIVAWLMPLFLSLAALGFGLLIPGVDFSIGMEGMYERFKDVMTEEQLTQMREMNYPVHPFFLTILQGLVAGITINAVAGFGEELGWRGLMYKEFKSMNFWKASVIIGFIWGVWHAPMILMGHNYPDHPLEGVFLMTLFCILFAPIFTLVRMKSRSVIAAAILHGSLNALAGLSIIVLKGGNDMLIGMTGLAGLVVLLLANALIFFLYPAVNNNSLEQMDPTLTDPVEEDISVKDLLDLK